MNKKFFFWRKGKQSKCNDALEKCVDSHSELEFKLLVIEKITVEMDYCGCGWEPMCGDCLDNWMKIKNLVDLSK